ncbi:MAG: hypothetical protein ACREEP_03855 [Dongiaceae bacterium]
MTAPEIGIMVLGALAGWWLVSWVIDKVRSVNARPRVYELPGDKGPGTIKDDSEGRS